jgi:hypothetical protein
VFERLYEHAMVLRHKLEEKKQRYAIEEVGGAAACTGLYS